MKRFIQDEVSAIIRLLQKSLKTLDDIETDNMIDEELKNNLAISNIIRSIIQHVMKLDSICEFLKSYIEKEKI